MSGGGVERTLTTYFGDKGRRTVEEGGGFTSSWGTLNGQDWNQNENGVVTLEDGFHQKTNPNDLALDHPDDPKYNVHVLGMTNETPRMYVVDVNPPDGYDEVFYYDATSFLLVKVVRFTHDRHRHVTEYSDFRTVFGKTVAFTAHSYDGRPQNDRNTTVTSIEKNGSPADIQIPAATGFFDFAGSAPVTLPAWFTHDGIIIRADVNGRGLDFLLDSGANGMFLDPGVAHELGLVPFGRYSETIGGGDVDMGDVRLAHMSVGALDLDNVVFTTTPMSQQVEGAKIVGLIGFDFLANGVFELDFNNKTLRILPHEYLRQHASDMTALPLELDDGIPRTDAWVEGVHGHFVVDTGADGIILYRDFVNRLPHVSGGFNDIDISTAGGSMSSHYIGVGDLLFSRVKFTNVGALLPGSSTFDFTDYDGLIGRNVLSTFKCYFDYADGMLYTAYDQ